MGSKTCNPLKDCWILDLKRTVGVLGQFLALPGADTAAVIGWILHQLLAGAWCLLQGQKERRLVEVCSGTSERSMDYFLHLWARSPIQLLFDISNCFYITEKDSISNGFASVRLQTGSLSLSVYNNEINHYAGKRRL